MIKFPHVHLDVSYEKGIDLHLKQEEARDKFPIEISTNKWGDLYLFHMIRQDERVECQVQHIFLNLSQITLLELIVQCQFLDEPALFVERTARKMVL